MYNLKIGLLSGLMLVTLVIRADSTIVGFEDTLNNSDKKRLKNFIDAHKKNGYTKCYYQTSEDTVVCENHDHEKVYFK